MKYLNSVLLLLVSLLLLTDIVRAETAGDLSTQGRASFVARDGHNLFLGNEGDDDLVVVQNNVTTFSIDGATGAITFTGTLTPELPNNTYLTAKNAAGDADINVLRVDATDDTELNADAGDVILFSIGGTAQWSLQGSALTPQVTNTENIGSTTLAVATTFTNIVQAATAQNLDIKARNGGVDFYTINSDTTPTRRWRIMSTGELLGSPATATDFVVGTTSVDAADSNRLVLTAASALGGGRSGSILIAGNEASGGGSVAISGGNVGSGSDIQFNLNHVSASIDYVNTSSGVMWSFDNTGAINQNATNGGNILMAKDASSILVGAAALTADVSANYSPRFFGFRNGANNLVMLRGSADSGASGFEFLKSRATNGSADTVVSSGDYLGAITWSGADGASFRGAANIYAQVAGTPGASDMPGKLVFGTTSDGAATPSDRWEISAAGDFIQNSSNGRNLEIQRTSTGIKVASTDSLTATGSAFGDALQLTAVYNRVATVAAGTGVLLWGNTSGHHVVVKNSGANALTVYPHSASAVIDANLAGVGVSVAAGATAIFYQIASLQWVSIEGTAA